MLEAAHRLEDGVEAGTEARHHIDKMLSHATSSKQARRDRVRALCDNREDIVKSVAALSRDISPKKEKKFVKQVTPPPKRQPPPSMPFNQVRSMFSEKMKAIMMQDRAQLRSTFTKYDTEKKGILTVPQFYAMCVDYDLGLSMDESKAFMAQFTSGKPFMSFQDFFQNLLGFPFDFFTMKLDQGATPVKKIDPNDLVKKLPPTTSEDTITSLFVRSLRRELYDVHTALAIGLKKEHYDNHLTSDHLFKIFHSQSIELSKTEVAEIMDHYDFDCDGKVDYLELIHELLDLPLPRAIRKSMPAPRRTVRPPLGPRTKQLMEMLRAQCRRAAVSSKKLDRMFSVYDQDGSGSIAYDEVQGMVKEFHCEATGKDAAAIILDRFSPSGAMNYDEFCSKVVGLPQGSHQAKELDPEEERVNPSRLRERISEAIKGKIYRNPTAVKKAFVMFDKDFGGSVSWPEFRDGFKALNLPANKTQVKTLFDDFRPDSDGEIGTKSFSRQLLGIDDGSQQSGSRMATPMRSKSQMGGGMVPPLSMQQRAASRGMTPHLHPQGGMPTRPHSSMELMQAKARSSRGASRLSIGRPSQQRRASAAPMGGPLVSTQQQEQGIPADYLIRPNTGIRTPEVVISRKPGTNRLSLSRAGSQLSRRSNVMPVGLSARSMTPASQRSYTIPFPE